VPRPLNDPIDEVAAWAASGAMALTGRAGAPPLGPPARLVTKLRDVAVALASGAARLGGRLEVDPLALLGERAAISGLTRNGTTSSGGATRLLPGPAGRWVGVSLARPEDIELVPAWLEVPTTPSDPWPVVADAVARRGGADLVDRARRLGLPVALLPASFADAPAPVARTEAGGGAERRPLHDTTVVDLSSLWAGPLCGSLLAEAGAEVIKVESTTRPDGARQGPAAFFDLLNGGKRSVVLELDRPDGVRQLGDLLAVADVVIEASRPRALEQMGIDAHVHLTSGRPLIWASITGHGRRAPERDWVAFGDDAAVAGGLVSWDDVGPVFCADAIADPTTGLFAAAAVVDALSRGGSWMLDVSLVGVAAHLAGPTLPVTPGTIAAPPRARPSNVPAPRIGEHTAAVLAGL
jgi:crotonobetainyl-CoA:carnitine CoA-transferase CaiB-like acyl-CoA transferase